MFEDTILRSTYRDHGDTCGNAQLPTRLRLWLGRLAMSAGVLLTLSVQYRRCVPINTPAFEVMD